MEIELLDHQDDFLSAEEKFVMLCGGGGSGKTWSGAHYVIQRAFDNPDTIGFIGANTYSQLHRATLQTLFNELDKLSISYSYKETKKELRIGAHKVICASMDNYDYLRGIEIGYGWLDEVRDMHEMALNTLLGRLRHKLSNSLELRLTTTPNGFTYLHDYFVGQKKTPEHRIIYATTYDNPYLPKEYLELLESNYDKKLFEQEVMGQFINVTLGAVYYSLDKTKSIKQVSYDRSLPIVIGMDFNVNPMTAVVCQITKDQVHVIDEFYLPHSNTKEMAEKIVQKYGPGHTVIPDSTGKALKTSAAGHTDHSILREHGLIIPQRIHNPYVVDRYNCVNNLLDKGRLSIDTNCINVIRDLSRAAYKEKTREMDTSDPMIGHISDALGYVCWHYFPLIKRQEVRVSAYA